MNDARTLGVYLHIPFCLKKCRYCDFCSFPGQDEKTVGRYVKALCDEITAWGPRAVGYTVDTVYFGGGTPTLLPVRSFEKILSVLRERFDVSPDAEVTTECNPATVTKDSLSDLRLLGINRLSVGVQSLHDGELRALGRIHSAAEARKTLTDAREAGFDNVSADLMFGIPEQTRDSFRESLTGVVGTGVSHISCYSLKIEEGTPFYEERQTLPLPDEETERAMYMDAATFLAKAGFPRYEISNFARPGFSSRHNLKYWDPDPYLGFGTAAHSFFGGKRFYHGTDLRAYLDGKGSEDGETLTVRDAAEEYVMLRMRLEAGISRSVFEKKFGLPFDRYAARLEKFLPLGLVSRDLSATSDLPDLSDRSGASDQEIWKFTSDGFYVSNSILSEVLDLE